MSILFFCASSLTFGQQGYRPLTGMISYEQLLAKHLEKEVEWTNPDGHNEKMKFMEMAIPVDRALTIEFEKDNYGEPRLWVDPRVIVFHAIAFGELKTCLEMSSFLHHEIPAEWGNLSKAGRLPNGAHFIVDRDGSITCLTPPYSKEGSHVSYDRLDHQWMVKRHQDGNPVAIGIENVTLPGNWTELTDAQVEANARLGRWLVWMEGGQLELAMSHDQFNSDRSYDLFLKRYSIYHRQRAYRTRGRQDIGEKALKRIVTKINDYGNLITLFDTGR